MSKNKFRAYHRDDMQMYWWDITWGNHGHGNGWVGMVKVGEKQSIHKHRDNMFMVDPDDCEIMQYTGLIDKNLKEIYEGDIIKSNYTWPSLVSWSKEYAGFQFGEGRNMFESVYNDEEWEVVGNIFESPETLKDEL